MKVQMKIQKILCITVLISAVIAFVMALGLLTDLYYVYAAGDLFAIVDGKYLEMERSNLYVDMQPFNTSLVNTYITLIVISAFLFVTLTHKRRNYYISNYIITGIVFGYGVYAVIFSISNILSYRSTFINDTDFETYKLISEAFSKVKYTESTFWLDINIAAAILVLIAILLLLGNLIWKTILMKKEKAFLSSQNIQVE